MVELRGSVDPFSLGVVPVVVVAGGDPGTADLQLPDALTIARHLCAIRTDKSRLQGGGNAALGLAVEPALLTSRLDRGHSGRPQWRHLGHAPRVDDLDVVPLLIRPHQRRRASSPPDDDPCLLYTSDAAD